MFDKFRSGNTSNSGKLFSLNFAETATVDPEDIQRDVDSESLPADAPPKAANYREADVEGISCASCSKFAVESYDDEGVPTGVCELWEARVKGDMVSDGYAESTPPITEDGEDDWEFSDNEFFLPGEGDMNFAAQDDLVWKEILREDEWAVTPTLSGPVKQKMKIVPEGASDLRKGIVSMEELEKNFKDNVIQKVSVPLTDDENDHKVNARINTGFVQQVKRVKGADGKYKMMAGIKFTEDDVKEKALRGTYADVSCGIGEYLHKRTGKKYNSVLKHLAITNTPWIDGLAPFGVNASENSPKEIHSYVPSSYEDKAKELTSLTWRKNNLEKKVNELNLGDSKYAVVDISYNSAIVYNPLSNTAWEAGYSISSGDATTSITLSDTANWTEKEVKEEYKKESKSEKEDKKKATPIELSDIEVAQANRKLLLSEKPKVGGQLSMPNGMNAEALAQLDLSDEQRQAVQAILAENAELRQVSRTQKADSRVEELKSLGFSAAPGALKFYRKVFLADDGEPAAILLSEDGSEKEKVSAIEILDEFIKALPTEDGKLLFSDQHVTVGNDVAPPANDEATEGSVEDRVAATQKFLANK